MSDKLDRFTRSAFIVLRLAQTEALRLAHAHISTDTLLLGMVEETHSLAGLLLREGGISAALVRQHIEQGGGREQLEPGTKPLLAPRLKYTIELAVDEARLLEHTYIGTEHLLLGLIRQEESQALDILRKHFVDLQLLRSEILREIQRE